MATLRNLKWTFEDLLPCYCYKIKTNARTTRSHVLNPDFTGKWADAITAWYQNSEHHIARKFVIASTVPSKKILHWANVCFSAHASVQPSALAVVKRWKRSKFYATLFSHISYEIWNVASARERDFTAQMVWWYSAIAQLHTLEGTLIARIKWNTAY